MPNGIIQLLYRGEEDFSVDPMLTETLTHGYNNIAKQQR